MNPVERYINRKLQERKDAGNLRTLKIQRAQVDLFSNDYLGVATNNLLELSNAGTGSTGSRLLSGNSTETEALEEKIAGFHRAEAALLFNSGYDANMGLLACVADRHTTFLYDELCHASIIDGIKLSPAGKKYKFRHNDIAGLAKKLEQQDGNTIAVVESVYSMDGDIAPLTAIAKLCEQHGASLIVDEAHATGIFGENGRGMVCSLGLEKKVLARVHTFGKALGCHGAAVVGSSLLKQFLVNFARPFIYTTALPPHSIAAIGAAYGLLSEHTPDNPRLHTLIQYFREKIHSSKGNWPDSISPIQVLILGSNEKARSAASALQDAGLQVNAILSPTVPAGSERLRICLHSFNTKEEVDLLFHTLNDIL